MTNQLRNLLARDADMCVACGLCVPLCPTYRATRNESESPRGRIMIMRELAHGRPAGGMAAQRLGSCLGCMACASACPSDVPYARMIPAGMSLARGRVHPVAALLRKMAGSSFRLWALRLMLLAGRAAKPLTALLPGTLREAVNSAPRPGMRALPPPDCQAQGPAAQLFTGCYGAVLDREALVAAIGLLPAAGWKLELPAQQGCCGALATHEGLPDEAAYCAQQNSAIFSPDATIAVTASGCFAELRRALPAARVREAGDMLLEKMAELPGKSRPATRIVAHIPCTQRSCGGEEWVVKLLERLTPAEILKPDCGPACCGAGGLTHLANPATGAKLAAEQAGRLLAAGGKDAIYVSSNHSCARHLERAFMRLGTRRKVRHPLAVFADHWSL